MADLASLYDTDSVPDREPRDFDLIPSRTKVVAQLIKASLQDTKDGSGKFVEAEFDIIDGPHTNRKVWMNFNIINRNPQAQEIGRQELQELSRAAVGGSVRNTDALVCKPFLGTIGIEKSKDPSYPDKNKFSKFENLDAADVPQAQPQRQAPSGQRPAAGTNYGAGQQRQAPPQAQAGASRGGYGQGSGAPRNASGYSNGGAARGGNGGGYRGPTGGAAMDDEIPF